MNDSYLLKESNDNLVQQIQILELKIQAYDREAMNKSYHIKQLERQAQISTEAYGQLQQQHAQAEINLKVFIKSYELQNSKLVQLELENLKYQENYAHIAEYEIEKEQIKQLALQYQQSCQKKEQKLQNHKQELLQLKNLMFMQEQKIQEDCDSQIEQIKQQYNIIKKQLKDKYNDLEMKDKVVIEENHQLKLQLQELVEMNQLLQQNNEQLVSVDNELQDLIYWLQDMDKSNVPIQFAHPVLKSLQIILTRLFEKNHKSKERKEKMKLKLKQQIEINYQVNSKVQQLEEQLSESKYLNAQINDTQKIDKRLLRLNLNAQQLMLQEPQEFQNQKSSTRTQNYSKRHLVNEKLNKMLKQFFTVYFTNLVGMKTIYQQIDINSNEFATYSALSKFRKCVFVVIATHRIRRRQIPKKFLQLQLDQTILNSFSSFVSLIHEQNIKIQDIQIINKQRSLQKNEPLDLDFIRITLSTELQQQIQMIQEQLDNQTISYQKKYDELERDFQMKEQALYLSELKLSQFSSKEEDQRSLNLITPIMLIKNSDIRHSSEQFENLFKNQESKVQAMEIEINDIYKLIKSLPE